MRFFLVLLAALTLTACDNPAAPKAAPICPTLVRADTILGDTNNVIRYYKFGSNDPFETEVGPWGTTPRCR